MSSRSRTAQIWNKILTKYEGKPPPFSRKAVYQLHSKIDSVLWKCDEDQFKSAQILLEEAKAGKWGMYAPEPVPIPQEPGFQVLAFTLPDILRKWGGRIRKLSMDSCC